MMKRKAKGLTVIKERAFRRGLYIGFLVGMVIGVIIFLLGMWAGG